MQAWEKWIHPLKKHRVKKKIQQILIFHNIDKLIIVVESFQNNQFGPELHHLKTGHIAALLEQEGKHK